MNLISRTYHSCERKEHAFIVLRKYTIISRDNDILHWGKPKSIYLFIKKQTHTWKRKWDSVSKLIWKEKFSNSTDIFLSNVTFENQILDCTFLLFSCLQNFKNIKDP